MPDSRNKDTSITSCTGVIFLFNLIVGAGALALPGAVQKAGWLMGITLLLTLGLFSFITVTFIVESLAVTNAVARKIYREGGTMTLGGEVRIEETPLVSPPGGQENVFEMTEKYELGQMGTMLSPKLSQIIIYGCLCIYLYGDLAIYAVVIARTCSHIVCRYTPPNASQFDIPESAQCFESGSLKRIDIYRMSVATFIIVMGPFVFFNMQKTKFLQICTSVMRWFAFFVMISWSIVKLITQGRTYNTSLINFKELPTLFGTLVYSFMCQHSIPGLLQPIKNKNHLKIIIPIDYCLAAIFYLLLNVTAILTFEHIFQIYTLNFWLEGIDPKAPFYVTILSYYLAMFPIFTFSTNFPIIAITLRNNLRSMILRDKPFRCIYDKFLFPLVTILPPTILALGVSDIQILVGIVGSYAGAFVQYFIPCVLVVCARDKAKEMNAPNIYASPFRGIGWVFAVYVWMVICLILISFNYLRKLGN